MIANVMAISKKYFHDHFVLLLLSINAFLAVAGGLFILLRLSTSQGTGFIVQYRSTLGIKAFKSGTVTGLLSLVAFLAVVLAAHTILSLRAYKIHRQLAIAILALGILLMILTIIISNTLLVLR